MGQLLGKDKPVIKADFQVDRIEVEPLIELKASLLKKLGLEQEISNNMMTEILKNDLDVAKNDDAEIEL